MTPPTGATCAVCGGPFTADQWDVRHTVTFGSTEAHADCCPECSPARVRLERCRPHADARRTTILED